LKPDGILALHVSNRYLDLVPVCASGAKFFGKQSTVVEDDADDISYLSDSTWVLVTADGSWFKSPSFNQANMTPGAAKASFRPWTDDYSNIFQILRFD
jgi:hypothetical protein